MLGEVSISCVIPRPIPTIGLPKIPTTITATTTSSSNSNTKLSNKLPIPKPQLHIPTNSPPDPNKPVINPITNRKSYDHITDRELRKKLKNRESAQAARDRKKAKMLALERQLADMAERNKLLENENRELRGRIQRSMEGNAMAAMMNQGMHPGGMAGHNGMIPGQNMENASHGTPAELHQIQNYQRQMQFLLEGNPAAAAAFHGQIPNSGTMANQMGATQMDASQTTNNTGNQKSTNNDTETIELAAINFPSLRLPTKGEPIDDDPFPDISTVGRHLSQQSGLEVGSSGELDDYILRNFKGEASPVSGKTGSTGYSSAGCESPDAASGAPSSPEFVASSWNNGNRSASSDSGHFSDAFSNQKFPSKYDK